MSSERLTLDETSEDMERLVGFLGLRVEAGEEGIGRRAGAGGIFIVEKARKWLI